MFIKQNSQSRKGGGVGGLLCCIKLNELKYKHLRLGPRILSFIKVHKK